MNWTEIQKRLVYHKVIAKPFDRYFFPVSIGIIAVILSLMEKRSFYAVTFAVLTLLWIVFQIWIQAARKKVFSENKKIKILEEGLSVETDSFNGVIKWKYYDKAVEDYDVFMFFKKSHSLPLIIDRDNLTEKEIKILKENNPKLISVNFTLR